HFNQNPCNSILSLYLSAFHFFVVTLLIKKQYIPTMLGLEIQINNDTPVTVAAENFSFVLLDTAMRQDDTGYIYAHGLDYSNSYHWISVVPRQGDKVKIQIVESPNPSPPVKTEKQDRKEMLARYEQLKKELEEKGLIAKED
ncbi:hypothetical protein, partial [Paraprevotella clara]|uniref:hypothetical protein n=2 Tax=Paraprevotella clara TaxID=454154 RepID=UPI00248B94F2